MLIRASKLVRWSRYVRRRYAFARGAFQQRRTALWYAWCWPWQWGG